MTIQEVYDELAGSSKRRIASCAHALYRVAAALHTTEHLITPTAKSEVVSPGKPGSSPPGDVEAAKAHSRQLEMIEQATATLEEARRKAVGLLHGSASAGDRHAAKRGGAPYSQCPDSVRGRGAYKR